MTMIGKEVSCDYENAVVIFISARINFTTRVEVAAIDDADERRGIEEEADVMLNMVHTHLALTSAAAQELGDLAAARIFEEELFRRLEREQEDKSCKDAERVRKQDGSKQAETIRERIEAEMAHQRKMRQMQA